MRPGFGTLRAALLATGSTILLASAAASASTVPVRLVIKGAPSARIGTPVAFTASAKLAKGNRLVVRGTRSNGGVVTVKECTRSPCVGSWRETTGGEVALQALSLQGTKTLGRSAKVVASWFTAVPGHYEGRTSQNETFRFDVAPDGRTLTGLTTGQINQSCEPYWNLGAGNVRDWKGSIDLSGKLLVHQAGNWLVYESPPTPGTYDLTFAGRVADGLASGTLRFNSTFTRDGTAHTCTSGDQTWTATKT